MIISHLSTLLGERKWTQVDLARKTGIRPNTINALYHNLDERISLEHLDMICSVLNCSVADIFEHVPVSREQEVIQQRVSIVRVTDLEIVIEAVLEKIQNRSQQSLSKTTTHHIF